MARAITAKPGLTALIRCTYTLSIKATGANGQATTVSTQVQGVVIGVNLTSNPPTLNVNSQNVQISQVTSISK